MGARSGGGGGSRGGGGGVAPKYSEHDYWGRKNGIPNSGAFLDADKIKANMQAGKAVEFHAAKMGASPVSAAQSKALKSIGAQPAQNGTWKFTAKSMNGLIGKANKLSGFSIYATGSKNML